MKINAVTPLKFNNNHAYHIQNSTQQNGNISQSGVYNPVYYKDYNVNIHFGKRSPEDFYSQKFNQDNMPSTMKAYLYEDYATNSKVAPVQIMQEAYDSLREAMTVDDIKKAFPNEEKFQKLIPANYDRATHGILRDIKEIKALQDTPEPLFKDGCDDLTTYLVKKIYLEGKTVKEIDKDFAKDINEIYQLAARVPAEKAKTLGKNESAYFAHTTVYRLGIRFPEVPFWNSFIATRDDYERVKRVRTPEGKFVNADSPEGRAILKRREEPKIKIETPEPRKYNFKRDNVKRISDTLLGSKDGVRKTMKELSRKNRDKEELTFLQQYWSEIMSVATEKVHLSEELIDFNMDRKIEEQKMSQQILDKLINCEEMTKREQTPLKIFWNERPDLKAHFSTAITDTMMLFTETFGADGKNARFQELVEYARSIKPTREEKLLEHARIQAEYDEMAKELDAFETSKLAEVKPTEIIETPAKPIELPAPKIHKYIINGQQITSEIDVVAQGQEAFKQIFNLFPKQTYHAYQKELEGQIAPFYHQFWLSSQIGPEDANISDAIKKVLFPVEKMNEIHKSVADLMEDKHNALLERTRLSLELYAVDKGIIPEEDLHRYGAADLIKLKEKILESLNGNEEIEKAQREIQAIFNQYSQPLSNKERIRIKMDILQGLKEYSGRNSIYAGSIIENLIELLSASAKDKEYAEVFKKVLNRNEQIFEKEGNVLRYLLDPNGNKHIKNIIREHCYNIFIGTDTNQASVFLTRDRELLDRVLRGYPDEKEMFISLARRAVNSVMKIK